MENYTPDPELYNILNVQLISATGMVFDEKELHYPKTLPAYSRVYLEFNNKPYWIIENEIVPIGDDTKIKDLLPQAIKEMYIKDIEEQLDITKISLNKLENALMELKSK